MDALHPLLADNVCSSAADPSIFNRDDFALKEVVDDIGVSFYPKVMTGTIEPAKRWQICDAFYAASKREGFYVAEMQTHIQALFNPATHVPPKELKMWCTEAIAAGCKSLIYWMWRPFDKGLQTMGRGLVDYKKRSTPRLVFAKELSKFLKETGPLTPITSKVGIVYDELCDVFQKQFTKNYPVDQDIYHHSLFGAYKAFLQAGCRADVIKLHEINQYKMVVISNHIVLDEADAALLRKYVQNGGIVVCDGKIGIVDKTSMLNKILPGGPFNDCMGQEYIDTDDMHLKFTYNGKQYGGFYGRDLMEVTDGAYLGAFEDGSPAVTLKQVGTGAVISVNTYLWYGYLMGNTNADTFANMLLETYALKDIAVDASFKVRICENETDYYAFVFNYTDETKTGHLTGYGFDETVTVNAKDVVVLRGSK